MIIEQSKSIGKTLNSLSPKQCKVFLFNTDIPTKVSNFTFDPTDPVSIYAAASAVVEADFQYDETKGTITFKGVPGNTGIHFKGHGSDISRSGTVNNLVPFRIATDIESNAPVRFTLLDMLNRNVSERWKPGNKALVGSYIEFEFEENSEIAGIDYRFLNGNTYADFSVRYWDPTLNEGNGDWVTAHTISGDYRDRVDFAQPINSSIVRIEFDAETSSNLDVESIYFFSNKTDFVNTPQNDVTWALIMFNTQSHISVNVLGDEFPFIWMNAGSALSPAELILAKVNHQPAQAARLIHCEIVADEVEDV